MTGPANVRALRHACERAVILADGAVFTAADFSLSRGLAPTRTAPAPAPTAAPRQDLNLDRAEKQLVEEALKKHSYNISLAAAELGLTRASLYRRMEKHGCEQVRDLGLKAPPLDGEGLGWGGVCAYTPRFIDVHPHHEQVRIAPRSEAMSGDMATCSSSPIKGEGFRRGRRG